MPKLLLSSWILLLINLIGPSWIKQVMDSGVGEYGVEFLKLDFSTPPDEHPHVDVILHKLSDDIMFRWGAKYRRR